jgi:phosphoglucosamine mutase
MTSTRYFGTDGIRGTFGEEPMTPEFVYRLGLAAGKALSSDDGKQALFVIGRDTRLQAPFAACFGNRFTGNRRSRSGSGNHPDSGIAYLAHFVGATAGAVISASHILPPRMASSSSTMRV